MNEEIITRPHRLVPEWTVFETADQGVHVVADPEAQALGILDDEWTTIAEARMLIAAITDAIAWLESQPPTIAVASEGEEA